MWFNSTFPGDNEPAIQVKSIAHRLKGALCAPFSLWAIDLRFKLKGKEFSTDLQAMP